MQDNRTMIIDICVYIGGYSVKRKDGKYDIISTQHNAFDCQPIYIEKYDSNATIGEILNRINKISLLCEYSCVNKMLKYNPNNWNEWDITTPFWDNNTSIDKYVNIMGIIPNGDTNNAKTYHVRMAYCKDIQ